MRLLVLRPEPGATATAKRIVAAGHEVDLMPLFHIAPLVWNAPSPMAYDALLLTSGNAVRMAGAKKLPELSGLPAYAVGEATAHAAREAGLDVKVTGTAGAAALLPLAKAAGDLRLLWLAGRDRMSFDPLPNMTIDLAIVYESEALPQPPEFAARVADADAVLLHSPRAAANFGRRCDGAGIAKRSITLGTLSSAIAEAAGHGWHTIIVADVPTDASLLSRLESGPTPLP